MNPLGFRKETKNKRDESFGLPERHDEKREEMTGCTEFQTKAAAGRKWRVEVCIGDFRRSYNFFNATAGCCLSKRRRKKEKSSPKAAVDEHVRCCPWLEAGRSNPLDFSEHLVAVRGGNKLCRCP